MIMGGDCVRIWKGLGTSYFKVITLHSLEEMNNLYERGRNSCGLLNGTCLFTNFITTAAARICFTGKLRNLVVISEIVGERFWFNGLDARLQPRTQPSQSFRSFPQKKEQGNERNL
jgi:hypothetical protein